MEYIFNKADAEALITRIENLRSDSQPQWGKMNVAEMVAHCNVAFEMVYTNKHPRPNGIARFFIKLLAKNMVVSEKPYPKNGRTAPVFLISDERELDTERQRAIEYIRKTQALGESHFNMKESHSFGKLTAKEWSNLFYKHWSHHLNQFGVYPTPNPSALRSVPIMRDVPLAPAV